MSLPWSPLTTLSWDNYYENDLENGDGEDDEPGDPSELDSWFDDVNAPAKTLAFLTSDHFPLSPQNTIHASSPSVLDLGTGNGSALLSLRLEGGYRGTMVGLDYSEQSIALARRLKKQFVVAGASAEASETLAFWIFDVTHDDPTTASWWPTSNGGFDLVLDKGTFDAISLSSETHSDRRIAELYPQKVATLVRPGGFFLITSCNWTEEEVIRWFTEGVDMEHIFEVYHKIKYPSFSFGGQQGQGVASICFRKRSN